MSVRTSTVDSDNGRNKGLVLMIFKGKATSWRGLSVAELTAATLQRRKITPAQATQPRRSGRFLRQRAAANDDR